MTKNTMTKKEMTKLLNDYGMPDLYHEDLLKGKKVSTLGGKYKILNNEIIKL